MKKLFFTKAIALSILFCSANTFTQAQAPNIQWHKCVGGSGDEYFQNVIKLHDGNYLFFGATASTDGDLKAKHGGNDAFLLKTNGAGNIIWKKTYGGSGDDFFNYVVETSNGNLYAIGNSTSNDGQVHGNHGGDIYGDVWIVKTNCNGNFLQQHCYGGSGDELAFDAILTCDNKIAFTGWSSSNDGDVSGNHGDYDAWIVKLKSNGSIKFSTMLGDTGYDDMSAIHEINGQYIVTGTKASVPSTTDHLENYYDAHAALLDNSGNIIWYHTYGGTRSDDGNFSVLTNDGNCVITGHTSSNDGDVPDNVGFNSWVWKIDVANNGNIIWQTHFGVVNDTAAGFSVFPTHDGGFVVVGAIAPNEEAPFSTWDAYMGKVDADGTLLWTKQFGGSDFDALSGGVEEGDNSLLISGYTFSNDGDVSGNHGNTDCWMVNLSAAGARISEGSGSPFEKSEVGTGWKTYPNPFSTSTTISFSLSQSQNVSLKVYDVNGRLIKTLASTIFEEGEHQIVWNAEEVNAGIYFLKMQAVEFLKTEKLIVTK